MCREAGGQKRLVNGSGATGMSDVGREEPPHVGGEKGGEHGALPSLDGVFGVGEEPQEHHGCAHHGEVDERDALHVHGADESGSTEDEQNVEHV